MNQEDDKNTPAIPMNTEDYELLHGIVENVTACRDATQHEWGIDADAAQHKMKLVQEIFNNKLSMGYRAGNSFLFDNIRIPGDENVYKLVILLNTATGSAPYFSVDRKGEHVDVASGYIDDGCLSLHIRGKNPDVRTLQGPGNILRKVPFVLSQPIVTVGS